MDAHFATAIRKVHKYIRETKHNVTAPSEIVTALRHDGGLGKSTADLIRIDRDSDMLSRWKVAMGDGSLAKLGRCAEFRYERISEGKCLGRTYEY